MDHAYHGRSPNQQIPFQSPAKLNIFKFPKVGRLLLGFILFLHLVQVMSGNQDISIFIYAAVEIQLSVVELNAFIIFIY